MSLILDALKKAEDKRSEAPENPAPPEPLEIPVNSTDTLNAQVLKALALKNWGLLCVCFFLCILIAVLVYLLLDSRNQQPIRAVHVTPNTQPIARTSDGISIGTSAIDNTGSGSLNTSSNQNNIDSLYEQNAPQASSHTPYTEPRSGTLRTAPATQSTSSIKDIKAMPKPFQESVPTIFYSQHNFPIEGEPSVILNKNTLVEGESLENGIFVHAILEDKVILIKDNQYFSLQARNSWINF